MKGLDMGDRIQLLTEYIFLPFFDNSIKAIPYVVVVYQLFYYECPLPCSFKWFQCIGRNIHKLVFS